MKKADFLKAVEHEVKTLKKIATKDELSKLNITKFNPTYNDRCIYGQMTGNCGSERAKNLMDEACIIVTNSKKGLHSGILDFDGQAYTKIKKFINGKNTGQGWNNDGSDDHRESRNYGHLSALEAYISLKGAKPKNIISFLRDETKELVL